MEKRFYESIGFTWLLLYFLPPVGILFLWGFRYYKPITRVTITIISLFFFLNIFDFTRMVSTISFVILIILFLNWTMHQVKENEGVEEKQEDIVQTDEEFIDIDYIDSLSPKEFNSFIMFLLNSLGYDKCVKNTDAYNHGVDFFCIENGLKQGILVKFYNEKIGMSAIHEMNVGLKYYQLQSGFVLTKIGYTNEAKQGGERVGILIWDQERLVEILTQIKLRKVDFASYFISHIEMDELNS